MPRTLFESTITIGQYNIPTYSWHVERGAYGQLGNADVHTSMAAMKAAGISYSDLSQQNETPVSLTLNGEKVFGGSYLHGFLQAEADEFHFVCRDFGGILFDTKRSLVDLNIQNQHVSDLVRQIINRFGNGLTPEINITNDPFVGNVLNEGAVAITYPQTMWNLLNYLARSVGATISTTPDRIFKFETITATASDIIYTWRANPAQANSFVGPVTGNNQQKPIMNLQFTHQPARNRNFSVVVVSHHQQSCVQTVETVTVAGQNIQVAGTPKGVKAGYYTGVAGAQLKNALSTAGNGIPIYQYAISGLKPDECRSRAQAIAEDIARRLLIANMKVDGNQAVQPLQQIQIGETVAGDLLGFADQALYITGVDHYFDQPQHEGYDESSGYWTGIKALTVPPVANPGQEIEQGGEGLGGGI